MQILNEPESLLPDKIPRCGSGKQKKRFDLVYRKDPSKSDREKLARQLLDRKEK